jgi:lactoylglutathione lyase
VSDRKQPQRAEVLRMKYLHTMVRVADPDESLDFYCNKLGFREVRRMESQQGRFTLYYLAAPGDNDEDAQLELTHNWDPETYGEGRNFGHLAYAVDDIYATCEKLMQKGKPLPKQEPWASMQNTGRW